MQQSQNSINASDSLVNASLPDYLNNNNCFIEQIQQLKGLQSPQMDASQKCNMYSFVGTQFADLQKRLNEINRSFVKGRAQLLKNQKDEVKKLGVRFLAKNDQLKAQIQQVKQEYEESKEVNQILNEEKQKIYVKNQQLEQKIRTQTQLSEFLSKIKDQLKQESMDQQENSIQIINHLDEMLRKKSQATFANLKPFIDYVNKRVLQESQQIQETSNKMTQQGKQYDQSNKKLQHQEKLARNSRSYNEIYDEMYNRIKYSEGLREYTERYKMDLELKNKQKH